MTTEKTPKELEQEMHKMTFKKFIQLNTSGVMLLVYASLATYIGLFIYLSCLS